MDTWFVIGIVFISISGVLIIVVAILIALLLLRKKKDKAAAPHGESAAHRSMAEENAALQAENHRLAGILEQMRSISERAKAIPTSEPGRPESVAPPGTDVELRDEQDPLPFEHVLIAQYRRVLVQMQRQLEHRDAILASLAAENDRLSGSVAAAASAAASANAATIARDAAAAGRVSPPMASVTLPYTTAMSFR